MEEKDCTTVFEKWLAAYRSQLDVTAQCKAVGHDEGPESSKGLSAPASPDLKGPATR